MSIDPVLAAIKNDFRAALDAFDSYSFTMMNIMANRIMSNVLFGAPHHHRYLVAGFLLKTVALELDQVPKEGYETDEILEAAGQLLNSLQETLTDKSTHQEVWTAYAKYHARTRLLKALPIERKAYKEENPQFTTLVADYIFQHSLTDLDTMCRVDGGIIRSSLNELERAMRVHGCNVQDLILHSLLLSFSRVFDYRYFEAMPPNGNFDSEGIKAKIRPSLDALLTFYKEIRSGGSEPADTGTKLLETFVLEWRQLFLKYYEIGRQPVQDRRTQIELPQAAKEQITESLRRAMQDEVTREQTRMVRPKEPKEVKD